MTDDKSTQAGADAEKTPASRSTAKKAPAKKAPAKKAAAKKAPAKKAPASTAQTGRAGETFGPYELQELLGRGGMGEVYRAHDTNRDRIDRIVALKLLPANLAEDPTFQERFRREAQTVARLDEPHVIPIHDFGEIDGQLYLDMRLVNGKDLRSMLREGGALPPEQAVTLVEQVASALDAAHAAGLIHRDVKPENVLVTGKDFAYLVDFGVAHAETDTHLTQTGTAIGSTAYMAPEQFEEGPVGPGVDVYALASVLFELLTGRQPYPGKSVSTITKGVLFGDVPVASSVNPAITPAMDSVLGWGLAKSPEQRCPTATELAAAARAALSGVYPPVADNSTTSLVGGLGAAPTTTIPTPSAAPVPSLFGPSSTLPHPTGTITDPGAMNAYQQPGYPSAYPPPPPPAPQQPARRSGTLTGALVALGILLAALVGVGVWLFTSKSHDDKDLQAAGSTVTTLVTDGETTTVTVPADSGPLPADLPAGAKPCPGIPGLATHEGRKTSCEFAESVRDAYISAGPRGETRVVNGWAPTQQASVPMTCSPLDEDDSIIVCRGGTQSIVYLY
ncbi:MAG: serine/threonine-protein kinase [Gordonia sp. (in: high G+C Gram-positive bacteria)]|uniref:serine/threonine-protein kinase n=1 Tax=Gordonia sp. (in: high G+C Gram-positive bacteria) TaxID=84139 RepID=UPI0039E6B322